MHPITARGGEIAQVYSWVYVWYPATLLALPRTRISIFSRDSLGSVFYSRICYFSRVDSIEPSSTTAVCDHGAYAH